jgi:phage-related protein
VANPIAEAFVEIRPDSSKFTKELTDSLEPAIKDAEKQADSFGRKVGSSFEEAGVNADRLASRASLVSTVALGAIGAVGGMAIKQASDLGESINAVNVTFGSASEGIKKLGEEAATAVGLSNTEFNALAVRFSAFASTIAGPGGDVVKTIDDMTVRAADFASVMNLDVNEAAQIFQSGLAGETEPLRKFGIDLSAAAVETYALANGLANSAKEMTEADKVQARYGLLMEQTNKTQGDFANTSDSLANRQRIMSAQIKNAGAQIGQALIPVAEKVVAIFQRLASWASQNTGLVLGLGAAVAVLATAIITITAAYKVYQTWQKLVTLYTALQQKEMLKLNATFLANPVFLIVAGIVALVAAIVIAYQKVEWFRNAVDAVFNAIKVAVGAVVDFFIAVWDMAFALVRGYLEILFKVWGTVFGWLEMIIRTSVGVFLKVFGTLFSGIKAGFTAVKDFVSDVFGAITGIVKGVINGVITVVEKGVNFAIKPINALIDGINRVPGINIPKIPELKIPRLADGAIIGGPTIAMVGEAGAEAVIPLTRPARAMSLMEQTGLAALARNGSAAVNIEQATFVAPVDADLVAQKVLVAERLRSFGS